VIDWFTDAFSSELTQRALVAGLLAAVTAAVVGTWVVIRGMSFFGEAVAHGVLPGIALAFVWGVDVTLGAMVSAVVMIAGIEVVHRRARLAEDTGIGLLFIGMLALGVIVISREDTYAGDLTSFLFGDILGVSRGDLAVQTAIASATLVAVVALHRPLLALSFNYDKARSLGQRPGLAHVALLVLLALAVVGSFRVVGTLLVFGLLVAPPAAATLLVKTVPATMVVAAVLGCLAVFLGLAVSYHADTAASATVAGVAVAEFFCALGARELAGLRHRARAAAES
jgi:manganese/iron transport system permease protein